MQTSAHCKNVQLLYVHYFVSETIFFILFRILPKAFMCFKKYIKYAVLQSNLTALASHLMSLGCLGRLSVLRKRQQSLFNATPPVTKETRHNIRISKQLYNSPNLWWDLRYFINLGQGASRPSFPA